MSKKLGYIFGIFVFFGITIIILVGCNLAWQGSKVTLSIDTSELISREFDGTLVPGVFNYSLKATEKLSGSTELSIGPLPLNQESLEITLNRGKIYSIDLKLTIQEYPDYSYGFIIEYAVPQAGEAAIDMTFLFGTIVDAKYAVDIDLLNLELAFQPNGPAIGSFVKIELLKNGDRLYTANDTLVEKQGDGFNGTGIDHIVSFDDQGLTPDLARFEVPFNAGIFYAEGPLSLSYTFQENLFAEWLFDNGSLDDSHYGSYPLTVVGAPSLVADKNGVLNSAYSFATGQYFTVDVGVLPSELSLSFWLKPGDVSTASHSLFKWDDGSGSVTDNTNVFHIYHTGTGGFSILKYPNTASQPLGNPVPPISIENWYHVAFSWNTFNNKFDLYINGGSPLVYQGTIPNEIGITSGKTMFSIGSRFFNLNGALDNVRLYQRLLTQTDVNGLYNNGVPH